MMAISHAILGTASWSLVSTLLTGGPGSPETAAAATIGALLPDIDHPQSWVGRRLQVVSVPLSMVVGHRGITHSLLAAGFVLLMLLWYGRYDYTMPLVIGYLSHLAGDALTPSGVPLFWPWKKTYSLNLFQTGGPIEIGVMGIIAAGAGYVWN